MTAKPGKYMWLERDYNDDDEEDDQKADGAEGSGKGKEKEGEVKEEEKEPEIIAAPETKVRLVLSSILVSSHTPLSPKLTFSHFFCHRIHPTSSSISSPLNSGLILLTGGTDVHQDLIQFIFNTGFINAHLAEMNYDANKLPLGKLAKNTILNGFGVLKVRL